MKITDNRAKFDNPEHSNSGKKKHWLYFDRTFKFTWRGIPHVFMRLAIANELWYKTYTRGDGSLSRVYKLLSLDIEEDQEDTTLKVYTLALLGFMISVAKI